MQINKKDLVLLAVSSNIDSDPIVFVAKYLVVLDNMPNLKSNEQEFANDDLVDPLWVPLASFKYNITDQKYYTSFHSLPIGDQEIKNINLSLKKLNLAQIPK